MRLLTIVTFNLIFNVNYFAQQNINRDSLLNILNSTTAHDTLKAKVCNKFVMYYAPTKPDSIIYYSKKGAALRGLDKKWRSHMVNSIGIGFYYKSEPDSALLYYKLALKLREDINDLHLISVSWNNIAVVYQIKGENKKAMDYHFKNLKYREDTNDQNGIAIACQNIGLLYSEQLDPKMALKYFLRCDNIRSQLNDTLGVTQNYLNLANTYLQLNKNDSAFYYVSRTINVLKRFGDIQNLAKAYNFIGLYYSKINDNVLAIDYFNKSKESYKLIGDVANEAYEMVNIGTTKLILNDNLGGYADCMQALPIVESSNYYVKMKFCYECLYRASKALLKKDEALIYHEKYSAIKDSLQNDERIKELTTIELNFKHNAQTELAEMKYHKDLEIKEQERRSQTIILYCIIVGLAVAVFLVFFVINRLKLTRKQNAIITLQKKEVEVKNHLIEEKQKEILDSINYAKRIQYTLLAHADFLRENIPEHFVYFNPKDIVSGDFYWAAKRGGKFYLAVCDSTGHGVPGAFMSLLNISFLSEAITEKGIEEPNKVFDFVRQRLIDNISKEDQKDGFDGILICVDEKTKGITYAAANNAPLSIINDTITELEYDHMPVSKGEKTTPFNLYTIDRKKGSMIYLYTDGYADQFGGVKGKKFMSKQMSKLLLSINSKPLIEQKQKLQESFDEWKGDLEQVDDVCVVGIKL